MVCARNVHGPAVPCLCLAFLAAACVPSLADGQREKSRTPTHKQLLMERAEAYLSSDWTQRLIARLRKVDAVERRQKGLPPRPAAMADPDIHATVQITSDPAQPRVGERHIVSCMVHGRVGDESVGAHVFCLFRWNTRRDRPASQVEHTYRESGPLDAGEIEPFGVSFSPTESTAGKYPWFFFVVAIPLAGGQPILLDAEELMITVTQ